MGDLCNYLDSIISPISVGTSFALFSKLDRGTQSTRSNIRPPPGRNHHGAAEDIDK